MEEAPPHQDFDDDDYWRAGHCAFKKGGVVADMPRQPRQGEVGCIVARGSHSGMAVQGCTVDLPTVTR